MTNPLRHIYRWLVFKVGDTRWTGWRYFPFIATWDGYKSKVKGDEQHEVMQIARPGDVLVLRSDGFASNLGIGGAMIHAALCIGNNEVIEALSDDQGGVVRHHILDCINHCDHLMVLRPSVLGLDDIVSSIQVAKTLVGFKYDVYFDFNSEKEREMLEKDYDKCKAGLVRFCCTEIPHFAYIDHVEKLSLYRAKNDRFGASFLNLLGIGVGAELLTADMYVESAFQTVWVSKTCTKSWFKKMGCSEKFLAHVKNLVRD